MSPQKIRFAILASLAKLQSLSDLEPSETTLQKSPTLPLSGSLFLWTFTTPQKVSLENLGSMWLSFINRPKMRKLPWRAVRFFEPHPGGHGWHVHAVAVSRYPVGTIRLLATISGFGRIHVKVIPASQAWYVLKYVTKSSFSRSPETRGKRLWACNGFRGYAAAKVVIHDSLFHEALSNFGYIEAQKEKLAHVWTTFVQEWAKQIRSGETQTKKQMNEAQSKIALQFLATGSRVQLVEYRGTKVRSVRKYVDGHPHPTEKQYYAVHLLESGGSPLLLEEPLPESYREEDKVSGPGNAKKGQTALLVIEKVTVFNGKETLLGKLHALA